MGVTNANLRAAMTVTETLEDLTSVNGATVVHDKFNTNVKLTPASTPPAAEVVNYEQAISGGSFDIDLTAAKGSEETVDATGLRLQGILVANPAASAGAVTVDAGLSYGYEINGANPLVVPPGGHVMQYYNDALVDVDATHKILTVLGTNGDVPQILLLLG